MIMLSNRFTSLVENRRTIFFIALSIRLIYIILSKEVFGWPIGSSVGQRILLAENILGGLGFTLDGHPVMYQTPVYQVFLAMIFAAFGKTWWSVGIMQALLDSFSAVIISKISQNFGKLFYLSGYIYTLYPMSITQVASVVDTSLLTFLFIFSIYQIVLYYETYRVKFLIVGALFSGLAILARPSVFILIPLFGLIILYRDLLKGKFLSFVKFGSLFLILSLTIPSIWIYRNCRLSGAFPILSVAGNHYFWYSHNKHVLEIWKNRESPDLAGKINKYPMDPNFQVSDFNYVPPKVQLETAKAASKEAWRYINNNPEQVIKYTWIKFKRFISGTYVIQNKRGTEKLLKWRILLYPLSNLPISVLAIIGLFVLIRKGKN
jgi:hypothetical protein